MASMKINRFALVLTVLNVLAMLAFWSQQQVAQAQAVPDMLRARGSRSSTTAASSGRKSSSSPTMAGCYFGLLISSRSRS
jgi:hypothetical protein